MVHLRGSTIGSVEVIRPLVAVGFDRNLFRLELDGTAVLGAAALPRRRRRQLRAPPPRRLDRHRRRLLGDVARLEGPEIGSAQFRPAQRSSAGSGSIGRPRTWISKWRWQPTVRALPVSPTAPTRSPAQTRSPRPHPRRPAQVGVEVAAPLALAVDQEVVAVEHRVEAAAGDPAAADRDQAGAAGGDDVEPLMGPPAAARRPELADRAPGPVRARGPGRHGRGSRRRPSSDRAPEQRSAPAAPATRPREELRACSAQGSTLNERFAARGRRRRPAGDDRPDPEGVLARRQAPVGLRRSCRA